MKTNKRLVRKVELKFFESDATGEWGLAHHNTINDDYESFDSFWSGPLIFHDVFEHSHEYTNKYFMGEYAMNVSGEVTAMGALYYYYCECGVANRLNSIFHPFSEIVVNSTFYEMADAISHASCRFGDVLTCAVPRQKRIKNDNCFENMIRDHWERIKELKLPIDKDEKEAGKQYRKSVSLSKLMRLYRYGYKMAERLVGDEPSYNGDMMTGFISFWDDFCKRYEAKTIAQYYKGVTVKLYKEYKTDLLSWRVDFVRHRFDDETPPLSASWERGDAIPKLYLPF